MKSVVFGSKFIIILLLLNYCNVSFAISKYFMEKATIDHNKRNEGVFNILILIKCIVFNCEFFATAN